VAITLQPVGVARQDLALFDMPAICIVTGSVTGP